jgi:hypothetical protein
MSKKEKGPRTSCIVTFPRIAVRMLKIPCALSFSTSRALDMSPIHNPGITSSIVNCRNIVGVSRGHTFCPSPAETLKLGNGLQYNTIGKVIEGRHLHPKVHPPSDDSQYPQCCSFRSYVGAGDLI